MNRQEMAHRGVEFTVRDEGDCWRWGFHPELHPNEMLGVEREGTIFGTIEMAIAAGKAAIDHWLERRNSK